MSWRIGRLYAIVLFLSIVVICSIFLKQASRTEEKHYLYHNILINAAPKSGSEYVAQSVVESLRYRQGKISSKYIPVDQVQSKLLAEFFSDKGVLSKQHMDASSLNLNYLSKYTDRFVVHVRDPREMLLSWVHHLNKVYNGKVPELLYQSSPYPPPGYFEWSLEKQIDWNIDNYLQEFVDWESKWVEVAKKEADKENGFKILFTRYDELATDPVSLTKQIIDFYGVPEHTYMVQLPKPSNKLNFRRGSQSEWRSVYNQEQKRKVAEIVPTELLEHFGWQP